MVPEERFVGHAPCDGRGGKVAVLAVRAKARRPIAADVALEQVPVLESVVHAAELAHEARQGGIAARALKGHVAVARQLEVVAVRTCAAGKHGVEFLLALFVTRQDVECVVAIAALELARELCIRVEVAVARISRIGPHVRHLRHGRRRDFVKERIARLEVEIAIFLVVRLELRAELEAVLQRILAQRVHRRGDPARLHVAVLAQLGERVERALAPAVGAVRVLGKRRGRGVVQHAKLRIALAARPHRLLVHQHQVGLGRHALGDVEVRIPAHGVALVVVLRGQDALLVEVVARERERGQVVAAGHANGVVGHGRRLVDQAQPVRVRILDGVEAERRAVDVTRRILRRLPGVDVHLVDGVQLGADVHPLRHVLRLLGRDVPVVRHFESARVLAAPRLHDHHAIRRARAVDGGRGGVLEHGHALDVERVEVVDLPHHAVHQDERAVVAQRAGAADADLRTVVARASTKVLHRDARKEPLKPLRDVRDGPLGDLLSAHDLSRAGDVGLDLGAVPGRNDHALQFQRGAAEPEIERRRLPRGDGDGLLLLAISQPPSANGVHARAHAPQGETAEGVAPRRHGGAIDTHARVGDGRAGGVSDAAGDDSCSLRSDDAGQ